jgi:glycosyltransferase involved in cell wall biosynthesis
VLWRCLSPYAWKKPLKIILIGPVYPYRGGIAHYTARLAQELSRRHDVHVLSFRRQFPRWLYPGSTDQDPSRQPISAPAEYLLEPLNPLSWLRSAGRVRSLDPDLVIFQWWVTFWSPAYATLAVLCRQAGISVVFLIHNVLPHEGGGIHRPLARLTLGRGQNFIVHTPEERKRLLSLLPWAEVRICPHPVYDVLAIRTGLTKEAARNRLNIAVDSQVLLFFGIVRPYKGLKVLLEALALLRTEGLLVELVVAGEFWESKDGYLDRVRRLGIVGQVRFEDRYIPNEELELFFTAADVAVAPYVGGTQSGVAALALGFGIPLVTTERSAAGLEEGHMGNVQVVPPGDAAALAEAIKTIFQDLPARSQASASTTFNGGWDKIVEAIENTCR